MTNFNQLLQSYDAGEITREEFTEAMRSSIVSYDYEVTPLNTVIVQWYTKEHYELNTGNTVSDDDWSAIASDWKASETVFGDCENHMYGIECAISDLEDSEEDSEE